MAKAFAVIGLALGAWGAMRIHQKIVIKRLTNEALENLDRGLKGRFTSDETEWGVFHHFERLEMIRNPERFERQVIIYLK